MMDNDKTFFYAILFIAIVILLFTYKAQITGRFITGEPTRDITGEPMKDITIIGAAPKLGERETPYTGCLDSDGNNIFEGGYVQGELLAAQTNEKAVDSGVIGNGARSYNPIQARKGIEDVNPHDSEYWDFCVDINKVREYICAENNAIFHIAECPADYFCHSGKCVDCIEDEQCNAGEICIDDLCVTSQPFWKIWKW